MRAAQRKCDKPDVLDFYHHFFFLHDVFFFLSNLCLLDEHSADLSFPVFGLLVEFL